MAAEKKTEKTATVKKAPAAKAAAEKKPAAKAAAVKKAPAVKAAAEKKAPAAKAAAAKKAPAAKKATEVIIQSPMGGNITPEAILAKVGKADKIYVRVDENKAYWVRGLETGSVDLWD
jgi:hypothetical protein